jgi:hypothetical protein
MPHWDAKSNSWSYNNIKFFKKDLYNADDVKTYVLSTGYMLLFKK